MLKTKKEKEKPIFVFFFGYFIGYNDWFTVIIETSYPTLKKKFIRVKNHVHKSTNNILS